MIFLLFRYAPEKIAWVELNIGVPEYEDVIDGEYDVKNYIEFGNWGSKK